MAELIQLPFRAGVDEGTDPKQLPPGTLKVGKNCVASNSKTVKFVQITTSFINLFNKVFKTRKFFIS